MVLWFFEGIPINRNWTLRPVVEAGLWKFQWDVSSLSSVCCWLLCWAKAGAGLNGNSEFQSFEKQMKSFTLFNCSEKLLFIWEDPSQKLALHHHAVIGDPRENDSFMMYLCSLHSSLAILLPKRPIVHEWQSPIKLRNVWNICLNNLHNQVHRNFWKLHINVCLGFNVEGARVACVYVPSHHCNPLMSSVLVQHQSSRNVHFYFIFQHARGSSAALWGGISH